MNLELLQFGKELIQLCDKVEELKKENITIKKEKSNLYCDLILAEQTLAQQQSEILRLKEVIRHISENHYIKIKL